MKMTQPAEGARHHIAHAAQHSDQQQIYQQRSQRARDAMLLQPCHHGANALGEDDGDEEQSDDLKGTREDIDQPKAGEGDDRCRPHGTGGDANIPKARPQAHGQVMI